MREMLTTTPQTPMAAMAAAAAAGDLRDAAPGEEEREEGAGGGGGDTAVALIRRVIHANEEEEGKEEEGEGERMQQQLQEQQQTAQLPAVVERLHKRVTVRFPAGLPIGLKLEAIIQENGGGGSGARGCRIADFAFFPPTVGELVERQERLRRMEQEEEEKAEAGRHEDNEDSEQDEDAAQRRRERRARRKDRLRRQLASLHSQRYREMLTSLLAPGWALDTIDGHSVRLEAFSDVLKTLHTAKTREKMLSFVDLSRPVNKHLEEDANEAQRFQVYRDRHLREQQQQQQRQQQQQLQQKEEDQEEESRTMFSPSNVRRSVRKRRLHSAGSATAMGLSARRLDPNAEGEAEDGDETKPPRRRRPMSANPVVGSHDDENDIGDAITGSRTQSAPAMYQRSCAVLAPSPLTTSTLAGDDATADDDDDDDDRHQDAHQWQRQRLRTHMRTPGNGETVLSERSLPSSPDPTAPVLPSVDAPAPPAPPMYTRDASATADLDDSTVSTATMSAAGVRGTLSHYTVATLDKALSTVKGFVQPWAEVAEEEVAHIWEATVPTHSDKEFKEVAGRKFELLREMSHLQITLGAAQEREQEATSRLEDVLHAAERARNEAAEHEARGSELAQQVRRLQAEKQELLDKAAGAQQSHQQAYVALQQACDEQLAHARTDIASVKDALQQATDEKGALEERLRTSEQQRETQQSQLDSLSAQLGALQDVVSAEREQFGSSTKRLEQASAEIEERWKKRVDDLLAQVTAAHKAAVEHTAQLEDVRGERDTAARERTQALAAADALQERLESLSHDKSDLLRQVEHLEEALKRAQGASDSAQSEAVQALHRQEAAYRDETARLRGESERLREELAAARAQAKTASEAAHEAQLALESSRSALARATDNHTESLKLATTQHEALLASERSRVQALADDLERMQSSRDRTQEQLTEMRKQMAESQVRREKLLADVSAQAVELQEVRKANDETAALYSDAQKQVSTLVEQMADMQAKVAQAEQRCASEDTIVAELQERLSEEQARAAARVQHLEEDLAGERETVASLMSNIQDKDTQLTEQATEMQALRAKLGAAESAASGRSLEEQSEQDRALQHAQKQVHVRDARLQSHQRRTMATARRLVGEVARLRAQRDLLSTDVRRLADTMHHTLRTFSHSVRITTEKSSQLEAQVAEQEDAAVRERSARDETIAQQTAHIMEISNQLRALQNVESNALREQAAHAQELAELQSKLEQMEQAKHSSADTVLRLQEDLEIANSTVRAVQVEAAHLGAIMRDNRQQRPQQAEDAQDAVRSPGSRPARSTATVVEPSSMSLERLITELAAVRSAIQHTLVRDAERDRLVQRQEELLAAETKTSAELRKQLDRAVENGKAASTRAQTLENQLTHLTRSTEVRCVELSQDMERHAMAEEELSARLATMSKERKRLQMRDAEQSQAHNSLREEHVELNKQLEHMQSTCDTLRDEWTKHEVELAQIAQMKNELQQAKQLLCNKDSEMMQMEARSREHSAELEALKLRLRTSAAQALSPQPMPSTPTAENRRNAARDTETAAGAGVNANQSHQGESSTEHALDAPRTQDGRSADAAVQTMAPDTVPLHDASAAAIQSRQGAAARETEDRLERLEQSNVSQSHSQPVAPLTASRTTGRSRSPFRPTPMSGSESHAMQNELAAIVANAERELGYQQEQDAQSRSAAAVATGPSVLFGMHASDHDDEAFARNAYDGSQGTNNSREEGMENEEDGSEYAHAWRGERQEAEATSDEEEEDQELRVAAKNHRAAGGGSESGGAGADGPVDRRGREEGNADHEILSTPMQLGVVEEPARPHGGNGAHTEVSRGGAGGSVSGNGDAAGAAKTREQRVLSSSRGSDHPAWPVVSTSPVNFAAIVPSEAESADSDAAADFGPNSCGTPTDPRKSVRTATATTPEGAAAALAAGGASVHTPRGQRSATAPPRSPSPGQFQASMMRAMEKERLAFGAQLHSEVQRAERAEEALRSATDQAMSHVRVAALCKVACRAACRQYNAALSSLRTAATKAAFLRWQQAAESRSPSPSPVGDGMDARPHTMSRMSQTDPATDELLEAATSAAAATAVAATTPPTVSGDVGVDSSGPPLSGDESGTSGRDTSRSPRASSPFTTEQVLDLRLKLARTQERLNQMTEATREILQESTRLRDHVRASSTVSIGLRRQCAVMFMHMIGKCLDQAERTPRRRLCFLFRAFRRWKRVPPRRSRPSRRDVASVTASTANSRAAVSTAAPRRRSSATTNTGSRRRKRSSGGVGGGGAKRSSATGVAAPANISHEAVARSLHHNAQQRHALISTVSNDALPHAHLFKATNVSPAVKTSRASGRHSSNGKRRPGSRMRRAAVEASTRSSRGDSVRGLRDGEVEDDDGDSVSDLLAESECDKSHLSASTSIVFEHMAAKALATGDGAREEDSDGDDETDGAHERAAVHRACSQGSFVTAPPLRSAPDLFLQLPTAANARAAVVAATLAALGGSRSPNLAETPPATGEGVGGAGYPARSTSRGSATTAVGWENEDTVLATAEEEFWTLSDSDTSGPHR